MAYASFAVWEEDGRNRTYILVNKEKRTLDVIRVVRELSSIYFI